MLLAQHEYLREWKMLMFSKTSTQSFVYDSIIVFMFPDDVVKEIY